MRGYIEAYLEDVMRNVGVMTHFCINEYGVSPEELSSLFLNSFVAEQIEKGNPRYLVGLSGKELADILMSSAEGVARKTPATDSYHVSPEYWAGWVMAYYQWFTGKSFAQMYADGQTFAKVLSMYHPMHEADLKKIVEDMNCSKK